MTSNGILLWAEVSLLMPLILLEVVFPYSTVMTASGLPLQLDLDFN